MMTHNKLAAAVLMSLMLSACQGENSQDNADALGVQVVQLSPLSTGDLGFSQVQAPVTQGLNSRREDIQFVSPMSGEYQPRQWQSSQLVASNEYWFPVSGEALNQGIPLTISQGGAVIRLAPRADMSSGALFHAPAIEPTSLELSAPKGAQVPDLVRSMANAEALASAGMKDDSSALLLSSAAPAGEYRLKVRSAVDPRSQYLVNVKEKGSPLVLHLRAPMGLSLGQSLAGSLTLDGLGQLSTAKARLRQGTQELPLPLTLENGAFSAAMPDGFEPGSAAALSELLIDVQSRVDGIAVKRTIKTAFKHFAPSGRVLPDAQVQWQGETPVAVTFDLELADAGRYALSAVLTGTDSNGKEVAIHSSEAARWFEASNSLTLPLSRELIERSGLKAPFQIRELELKDQGQMATLSFQDKALQL